MTRSASRQPKVAPPSAKSRLAVSISALLAAGAALAGCSQMSPQTTQLQYAASDGVVQDAGALGVRNLLLVTDDGGGETANVVGTFVNSGETPFTLTVATENGQTEPIQVPAGGTTPVGVAQKLQVPIDAQPGLLVPVTVSGSGQELTASVPLLDGTLPEYATLTPSPAGASPVQSTASAAP